jgi:hypothetical protein
MQHNTASAVSRLVLGFILVSDVEVDPGGATLVERSHTTGHLCGRKMVS